MGRTYAGAREDMSDVVGTSSSAFSAASEGGAVYEGDGYHLRTGDDGGPGEGVAPQRCCLLSSSSTSGQV